MERREPHLLHVTRINERSERIRLLALNIARKEISDSRATEAMARASQGRKRELRQAQKLLLMSGLADEHIYINRASRILAAVITGSSPEVLSPGKSEN